MRALCEVLTEELKGRAGRHALPASSARSPAVKASTNVKSAAPGVVSHTGGGKGSSARGAGPDSRANTVRGGKHTQGGRRQGKGPQRVHTRSVFAAGGLLTACAR